VAASCRVESEVEARQQATTQARNSIYLRISRARVASGQGRGLGEEGPEPNPRIAIWMYWHFWAPVTQRFSAHQLFRRPGVGFSDYLGPIFALYDHKFGDPRSKIAGANAFTHRPIPAILPAHLCTRRSLAGPLKDPVRCLGTHRTG
jgi:hypothetical protein